MGNLVPVFATDFDPDDDGERLLGNVLAIGLT